MRDYAIEMLNITKRFPGIIANDNITLQLKKGEIHALLRRKWRRKINADECICLDCISRKRVRSRKDGKKV